MQVAAPGLAAAVDLTASGTRSRSPPLARNSADRNAACAVPSPTLARSSAERVAACCAQPQTMARNSAERKSAQPTAPMLARRSFEGQAKPLPALETKELTLMDEESHVQHGIELTQPVLESNENDLDIQETFGFTIPEVRSVAAQACRCTVRVWARAQDSHANSKNGLYGCSGHPPSWWSRLSQCPTHRTL